MGIAPRQCGGKAGGHLGDRMVNVIASRTLKRPPLESAIAASAYGVRKVAINDAKILDHTKSVLRNTTNLGNFEKHGNALK